MKQSLAMYESISPNLYRVKIRPSKRYKVRYWNDSVGENQVWLLLINNFKEEESLFEMSRDQFFEWIMFTCNDLYTFHQLDNKFMMWIGTWMADMEGQWPGVIYSDFEEWINQKGYQFPLTLEQEVEFKLRFIGEKK